MERNHTVGEPPKYGKDGPFVDPVVRCDACQKLIKVESLCKIGMCPSCSNTRVRNVRTMSDDEMIQLRGDGVDPVWLDRFDKVEL